MPLSVPGGDAPPGRYSVNRVPPSVLPLYPSSTLDQNAPHFSHASTQGQATIDQLYASSYQASQRQIPQQPFDNSTTLHPPPVPAASVGRRTAPLPRSEGFPQTNVPEQRATQSSAHAQRPSAAPQLTVIPGFFIVDPTHAQPATPGAPGPGYFVPLPGATHYTNWFAAAAASGTTSGNGSHPGAQHAAPITRPQAERQGAVARPNPT
ncbi:hypothetical protein OH77DRAFT_1263356 [Trametes cingulata]|nr:hypothetical protein OH77DRAFT_1263356 [Trametes cingulata]